MSGVSLKGEEEALYIKKSRGNPKKYNTAGGSKRTDDKLKSHQGEGSSSLGGKFEEQQGQQQQV